MAWISRENLEELKKCEKKLFEIKERQRYNENYQRGLDYFVKSIIQVNRFFIQSVGYELHNPDNRIVGEYSYFNLKVYNFEIQSNGREFLWMFGYKNKQITYKISLNIIDADSYSGSPKGSINVIPLLCVLTDEEYIWKKKYQFNEIPSFFEDIKKNLQNDDYLNKYAYTISNDFDDNNDDMQDALNSYEPPIFDPED
jgi:hypothetical protein